MDHDVLRIPALIASPATARTLPLDPGHPSAQVMRHGSMELRWYVPREGEPHLPHDRDEIYFIVSGTATFCRGNDADPFDEDRLGVFGEQRVEVRPGDALFVPAGAAHGFSGCSDDFAAWTVFYGPEGGERE